MKETLAFAPTTDDALAINKSLSELLIERRQRYTESLVSPENVLHYSHGTTWKHPANRDAEDGSMETHSAEMSLPFDRLRDGDLSLIAESLNQISEDFRSQMMRSMYELINRTCESTGNVINAAGDFPQAFKSMLERIEFGVDRDGKVTFPQVHTGDAKKLLEHLESQPPEFREEIDRIIARKSEQAMENELNRKSRFKGK